MNSGKLGVNLPAFGNSVGKRRSASNQVINLSASRAWPATPLALSNRVRRAASGLRELGIDVKIGLRSTTRDRKRLITVFYSGDA